MADPELGPLIQRPTPLPPRQNKRTLLLLGLLVALAFGVLVIWRMGGSKIDLSEEARLQHQSEQTVTGAPSTPPEELLLPKSALKPPALPPPTGPSAPPASPPQPPGKRWIPPPPPTAPGAVPEPPRFVTPPSGPAPGAPLPGPPPASRPHVQPPAAKPVTLPVRWFAPKPTPQGDLLKPPHPEDPADQRQSKLFPQAAWETPQDPTRVLYADQIINGLLMQNLNSDTPGTFRIKTTQDVTDRFGQGVVLLPIDTVFLGSMEGQARYGQQRIPAQVTMAIMPDGTAVNFTKGQAGDEMGAAGIPAKVNNHYFKLILGVGLQAILNIGTRAVGGSTTSFNPTLEQEFAQDVARSTNRTAQDVMRRELQVNPTLTQKYGYPVTVQFAENVSFQSRPTLVRK